MEGFWFWFSPPTWAAVHPLCYTVLHTPHPLPRLRTQLRPTNLCVHPPPHPPPPPPVARLQGSMCGSTGEKQLWMTCGPPGMPAAPPLLFGPLRRRWTLLRTVSQPRAPTSTCRFTHGTRSAHLWQSVLCLHCAPNGPSLSHSRRWERNPSPLQRVSHASQCSSLPQQSA